MNTQMQTRTQTGLTTEERIHSLPVIGTLKRLGKLAFPAILIAALGFSALRHAPATANAESPSRRAAGSSLPAVPTAADIDRIDHAFAAKTTTIAPPTTITAPARDSLRVTAVEGSTITLAPGATLIIGPKLAAPSGLPVWNATLSGSAHLAMGGAAKTLVIYAATGRVTFSQGTYDVRMSPSALMVHNIAGATALLYKRTGWKSRIPHKIGPGATGGWEQDEEGK